MNRTSRVRLLASLALLLAPAAQAQQAQQTRTVETDQGAVVGREAAVQTFFGIPYAAPPVGDLRWRAPQPPQPWRVPRDAGSFGNVCPQLALALFPAPGVTPGQLQGDEDCLYLNVYAPRGTAGSGKLPVLVWIHGGSFTNGAGSFYDGSVLAEKYGLMVVTLNYRLGALGFLALPRLDAEAPLGASGNYGLLDQQAALRWVRDNIAAFGGDPANVTVAGESAGALSVCDQLASPTAAGLFQKAIVQSGLCTSPGNAVTLAQAGARNQSYAARLGCSVADLACLRRVPVSALLATKVPGLRPLSNLVWSPVYGGGALPLTLEDAFGRGRFNRVPVLLGTNHDEGRLFVSVASPGGQPLSAVQYWGGVGLLVGVDSAQRVLAQYPIRAYGTPALALTTLFTDGVFSCPARNVAAALSRFVPVHAYEFDDPQAATGLKVPAGLPGLGSFHGGSLVYAFGTPIPGVADPAMFSPAQRRLSDAFSTAWARFAGTGDPNPADGAQNRAPWRPFEAARGNLEVFTPAGSRESVNFSAEHKCAFWSGLKLN